MKKSKQMKYDVAKLIRNDLAKLKGDKIAHGASAIALGLIGEHERETVDLLIKLLSDRGLEKKLRGKAAVALGLIAEWRDFRVLYRISEDINYRASVPALTEILTIL